MNTEPLIDEARRIAGQPVEDRLDGKQAEEAEAVMLRLAEAAGLDYGEALNLMSTIKWGEWDRGWKTGYAHRRNSEQV